MKRLLVLTLMALSAASAWAYDFSYTYQGKTMFYSITNSSQHRVQVDNPTNGNYYSYVTGDIVIPDSVENNSIKYAVTSISNYAFRNCNGLTSVTIPNSVTSMGSGAFSGCSGLTSVTIPNSVTSISSYAFENCRGLTSVTIPNSVTSIGSGAFYWCSGLTSVTIPNSVTSIGSSAFYNCSGLTSVTIPNSVTSIGSGAFYGCSGLTSVTIPNSVTSIGTSAFRNCSGLTSVAFGDSVTSIGGYAFYNCSGLTSVNIPTSVTSIGDYAFYNCGGLTSITIPNSVTSIGNGAFGGCSNLSSIMVEEGNMHYDSRNNCNAIIQTDLSILLSGCYTTVIPSSITAIGDAAFQGCTGLNSVTIPNLASRIGNRAFAGCSGLTSVVIPNSVTSIGTGAFYGCSGLTYFSCLATIPPTLDSMIIDYYSNYNIFVPCQSVMAYQSSFWWSFHSSRIHGTPTFDFSITIAPNIDTFGLVSIGAIDCDSNVTVTATANMGYQFIGWSDGGTGNPRTIHITSDTTITALFDYITYAIVGQPNIAARGTVTGSDTVYYGDTVTLTATANYGYYFNKWNDNVYDNPRHVVATQNRTLTAQFGVNQYSISLAVDTSSHGSVSGAGYYNYLTNRTVTATPATGYHFTHWNDGNIDNPRVLSLTQDTVLTAFFEINTYQLTVLPNDSTLGSVTGSGSFTHGTTVTVTATPFAGNRLDRWDDNTLLAIYSFTLTGNRQLIAVFVPADTIFVHDTTYIDVYDTIFFGVHDTTYIDVIVHDTTTVTVVDTVDNYIYDTTIVHDTTIVTDTLWRIVHDTIYLPQYIHDTIYIHDTVVVGMDEVDVLSARIYTSHGQIVVEGAEGNTVTLYDVTGRVLATKQDDFDALRFEVPASGTYIIKIGTYLARRVVVIR